MEYEKITQKKFDEDLKVTALVEHSPEELKAHLELNASVYENDYGKLRTS